MQALIILCTLSMPFMLKGQKFTKDANANINWSAEYNEPNNSFLSRIIHSDKNGFYTLRIQGLGAKRTKPNILVEYYAKAQMKMKKSIELDLKYNNKRRDFEDVIMAGDQLYFLTSFNNQAKKRNYLFAQKINLKTLRPSKKLIKLAEVETRNLYQEGGFRHHLSKDTSKVLIYASLPKKKKQPERFSLQVFDKQLDLLWDKEVRLPFNDENFAVQEYKVDNEGNVYMLGLIYEDGKRLERGGKPNYQYVILAYRNNGESVEEYKINLNQKFITDLTFRVAKNGELIFSGFYSDKGTYSAKGTYFFRLDPISKEISNKNLKPFDFDFLTEYLTDTEYSKAKKNTQKKGKGTPELYRYALDDLILRSDGGAVLVAEQYFVQRRYNNNYGYNPSIGFGFNRFNRFNDPYNRLEDDYEYYYNDIIVVNIRPNGEIEWTARIPKQQLTRNDGGYYYKWFSYTGRNSVITLAEVNKNGKVDMKPLFSGTEASVTTRPKVCKQVGSSEMLIYGERGRTFRFGALQFE